MARKIYKKLLRSTERATKIVLIFVIATYWLFSGHLPFLSEFDWFPQPQIAHAAEFAMEVQRFTDLSTTTSTKPFLNTYENPVIILTAEPNATWTTDDPPFGVNFFNASTTGVEMRISIPDRQYGSGNMPSNNTVYMMVVEQGYWDSNNSDLTFKIEAQKFTSSGVNVNNYTAIGTNSVSRSLDSGWGSTPHVYLHNASIDNEPQWIETAIFGSTTLTTPPATTQTSGILVGLSSAETTPQDNHADETIHMVVIESGNLSFDSQNFRAFRTADTIEEYTHANLENHNASFTPIWGVADLVAVDGNNGGWANWEDAPFSATQVEPYVQEDRYADSETGHTDEEVDVFIADTNSWSYLNSGSVRQEKFHWRNDDGTEATASSATDGNVNTSIEGYIIGDNMRIRIGVNNNTGATTTQQYRLEYGTKSSTCGAVASWNDVGAVGGAFDMYDSANLNDGDDTTDIATSTGGFYNSDEDFEVDNNAVKDTGSTTGNIELDTNDFVELEYSLAVVSGAIPGSTYCLRVSDAGTPLDAYLTYPEITITSFQVIGETGQVTTDYIGTTVQLNNTYTQPVIIVEPIGGDLTGGATNRPANTVITATGTKSFDVRVQEPDNEADDHGDETFAYMVMEAGRYTLPDGVEVDAGLRSTTNFYGNGIDGDSDDTCSFSSAFGTAPVVLASLQSDYNPGASTTAPDFVNVSIPSVGTVSFSCAIEVPDNHPAPPETNEIIGWIAFENTTSNNNGVQYESNTTGSNNVSGWTDTPWHEQTFLITNFSEPPLLYAHKRTRAGADGGWVRYDQLYATSTKFAIDERDDSDRSHGSSENVSYVVWATSSNIVNNINYEQSSYRWFANDDSTDVGAALAAQDTSYQLTTPGEAFRLRTTVSVGGNDLRVHGEQFKLQYSVKSGTCDPLFAGENYTNVTATSAIAYNDNTTPNDEDPLTDNVNDPVDVGHSNINQTYQESNNFTVSEALIPAGDAGLWDFPLFDNGAPENTTYCLRIVREGETPLDTYSWFPEIQTAITIDFTQQWYRWYVDNDGIDPTDPWPVGVTDLAENAEITSSDSPPGRGENLRLRINILVSSVALSADTQKFALQYGERTTTCSAITSWNYIGNIASTTADFRGFDGSPAEGATIPGGGNLNISISDVAGTYQERATTTVNNPNAVSIGQEVEYDWAFENYDAAAQSDYCFRIVEDDGSELTAYNNYPALETSGLKYKSRNWRWYDDESNETPTDDLALENVAPIDIEPYQGMKLRFTVAEIGAIAGINNKFRLQYSTLSDFSSDVNYVTSAEMCTASSAWCYHNGVDNDDDAITTAVLTDSTAKGVHNETATSTSTFDPAASTPTEYEFTIKNLAAEPNTTYYFRVYDYTNGDVITYDEGETYASLSTAGIHLDFTISGLSSGTNTEGITTDVSTTPTGIDFGTLPFDTETEAAQRLTVTTDATNGYMIYAYQRQGFLHQQNGIDEIDPVTGTNVSPTGWSTGCAVSADSCFGYHTGDDLLQGGSARFSANDSYAKFDTSLEEVVYTASSVIDESNDMVYKTQVDSNMIGGGYQTTVVYIIVPTY